MCRLIPDCDAVLHIAAPLLLKGNKKTITTPMLQGTDALLKACVEFKVKRCVLTSTTSAIINPNDIKEVYDERDWYNIEKKSSGTNTRAKVTMERNAWKYYHNLGRDCKFQLVVLCPGFVVGKSLNKIGEPNLNFMKVLSVSEKC